jgi:plasmid stability protein
MNPSLVHAPHHAYNDLIAIIWSRIMASLTIRNIDDDLKQRLRLQAARHGCSMEQEARNILRAVVAAPPVGAGFAQKIQQRFAGLDAGDLPIPARRAARLPRTPQD